LTRVAVTLVAGICLAAHGQALDETQQKPTVPDGVRDLDRRSFYDMSRAETKLIAALRDPMVAGLNVEDALTCWFEGREADAHNNRTRADAAWTRGLGKLTNLEPLPAVKWPENPDGNLKILRGVGYEDAKNARIYVVSWVVDNLTQYGVLVTPDVPGTTGLKDMPENRFPLLLYMHGAAYGVPLHALPWLARIAATGYVIIGPAMRGEDLFAAGYQQVPREFQFKCEGQIENLDGEVNDALSAVAGARKMPFVKPGPFGIIGHSFGAGAGLLVTVRSKDVACMVSYDAWLTNPFRYVWDRMRRGANNWQSWEEYCNQPVRDQLSGLKKRSIVHNADQINCPLLLFMGGAYEGSVFHKSHADLVAQLKKHKKEFIYEVIPEGGHNFVLYYESKPAKYAFEKHMNYLRKHFPPASVSGNDKTGDLQDGRPAAGSDLEPATGVPNQDDQGK